MGSNIGYIRVSSAGQNEGRQLEGVDLEKTFTDKASGGSTDRPKLQEMLEWVREGDIVHVHSMDRLARNLSDLRSTVKQINKKGATVRFQKEGLEFSSDSSSPMSELMLNLLGAVAQFERSLIRERQREGIELAKKRGAYKGRKKALNKSQVEELKAKVEAGAKKAALAREYGITRATLYKYLAS